MREKNTASGPNCAMILGLSAAALALAASGCIAQVGEGEPGDEIIAEREEAVGTLYKVGPSRQYKNLSQVASLLQPGDIVEVDGDATYGSVVLSKNGTASSKITIRGVRVNGKRPKLSGGYNTIELAGDHTILEGFEITGGSMRCVFHHAHDITVRDTVIHDCPSHGLLGADSDSGSLLMEYVEMYACGSGTTRHTVYMATDESAHPGSVFRMRHCYIHDTNGGNAVKSRAERNEIYYNWIEGGLYKELELIGPDGGSGSVREDSDVVGNVFRKTHTQYVVRIGGDGTGETWGRYRFANNTFLLTQNSSAAIHIFDGIESVELHNNIFYRVGGGSVQAIRNDGAWATGSVIITGTKNSFPQGSTVPASLSQTIYQNNPGFVNVGAHDVALTSASPLRNVGTNATASPPGHAFPSPLALPLYHPPPRALQAVGSAVPRAVDGSVDLGAFEYGAGAPPPPPPPPPSGCTVSDPGVWVNTPMTSQTGTFTATWDVTPGGSAIDGVIGLSLGSKTAWTGLAAIVLFDVSGRILVRNGSAYQAASNFYYTAGQTYKVRMVVSVPTRRYSVYVQAPGGQEVQLANQYAFRTEQSATSQINNWTMIQTVPSATLTACNFALQ